MEPGLRVLIASKPALDLRSAGKHPRAQEGKPSGEMPIKKVSRSEYPREPLPWLAQQCREDVLIQVRSDGALISGFRHRAPRRDTSAKLAIALVVGAGMM
jgi:hypothetical protein